MCFNMSVCMPLPLRAFLPGLGRKANAIIHLQYLKLWEGGGCRTGEGLYLLMAKEDEMTASGRSRSREEMS